ncbi:hypothetical protein HHK36_008990 [Tetracentron sinense]|uniref:WAT1-related protein n=1 Tax=Tetracentron sinense TaxID=13715 RepID=A0A834ZEK0_TETSI|nr:hypothetical protein HHK36_008990 [Tetracentron sinense]
MGNQRPSELQCVVFSKVKSYLAMVSLQFGYAGMYIITMLSLNHGTSHYVLVVYRHAIATLVVAPFALENKAKDDSLHLLKDNGARPVIDQNLYCAGMKYTSATFGSAIFNVVPSITFIMAIIFRLERVKIKKAPSQAKVVGTLVTLVGAMVMTLYKGPIIDMIGSRGRSSHESSSGSTDQHWVAGTLMLLASCCAWSAFFILQSFTLKSYPAELSMTSLICLTGMVQGAAVALVMERDSGAWSLGWDSGLLAAVYSGIVCSGITYYVQGVVMKERGPVFVTAFNPLCMIIVAALGSLVLSEQIHLGSVIGAIIIVSGLYCVVWGKSKDHVISSSLTSEKVGALELPIAATNVPKAITVDNDNKTDSLVLSEIPMSKEEQISHQPV